jgi:hypothetical protein
MKKPIEKRKMGFSKYSQRCNPQIVRMILHDLDLCMNGAAPDDPRMLHLKTDRRKSADRKITRAGVAILNR